jgi:hypothetical protein
VQEAEALFVRGGQIAVIAPGFFQQRKGAVDVRADELLGTEDGSVHMALGGEVHEGCRLMLAEKPGHQAAVVDVSVDELIAAMAAYRGEVPEIAGIGQAIEVHQRRRLLRQPMQDEVGSDKSGTARDNDGFFHRISEAVGK